METAIVGPRRFRYLVCLGGTSWAGRRSVSCPANSGATSILCSVHCIGVAALTRCSSSTVAVIEKRLHKHVISAGYAALRDYLATLEASMILQNREREILRGKSYVALELELEGTSEKLVESLDDLMGKPD